jgi:hypothetical protein
MPPKMNGFSSSILSQPASGSVFGALKREATDNWEENRTVWGFATRFFMFVLLTLI